MVKASRAYALSRREASPGLHAHGALATISAPFRSGQSSPHYTMSVPVSPSIVSREASRDLWRSIGHSTTAVFKLRTLLSAHPLLCPQM